VNISGNSFLFLPQHILKLINQIIIPIGIALILVIVVLAISLKNSFMVIIESLFIIPTPVFIKFEQKVIVGYFESDGLAVIVELLGELVEARVGLSLFIHI